MLVILLTGLYTMLGGMRAVAYNDSVQAIVLIIGSATLTIYGLLKLGGWWEGDGGHFITYYLGRGWTKLCEICGSDMFNLWKPLIPAGQEGTWAPVIEKNAAGDVVKQAWYFNDHFPWLGMAICAPVIGLWYWCTDQYIVQRALGAPNQTIARRGSICAAFLKLTPGLPVHHSRLDLLCLGQKRTSSGVGKHGRSSHWKSHSHSGSGGFSHDGKAPPSRPGLRGIVVAGLLSALMGSLAGVFNACATLFTVDLYEKMRPKASQSGNRAHGSYRHRRS